MVGTSNLGSWNGHWNWNSIYIYLDVYSIFLKIHVWKWHMSLDVSSISIHYILDNMSLKPLHRTFCFHACMICFFWLVLEAPFRWMWMAPFITILESTLAHWQESHRFHDFPWSDHDFTCLCFAIMFSQCSMMFSTWFCPFFSSMVFDAFP
jgi:hypothetical protein